MQNDEKTIDNILPGGSKRLYELQSSITTIGLESFEDLERRRLLLMI